MTFLSLFEDPTAISEHQRQEIEEALRVLRSSWPVVEARIKKFGTPFHAKMWILPDGQVQPLNQWHWAWLKAHLEVAQRFGIADTVNAIGTGDEDAGRKVALKVGFFRVNYEKNSGRLTIEGCQKFWRSKIHDAVFVLVMDNDRSIDFITVTLFDDGVTTVVKTGSARLLDTEDQDKVNHIPLLSESPRGKALRIVAQERRVL